MDIWNWIILLVGIVVIFVLPAWLGVKVASRAGFAPASGILLGVPLVSLVTLWVWAFRSWPLLDQARGKTGAEARG